MLGREEMGGVGSTGRTQQAVQGHRSGPLNWLGKDLGDRRTGGTLGVRLTQQPLRKAAKSKGKA